MKKSRQKWLRSSASMSRNSPAAEVSNETVSFERPRGLPHGGVYPRPWPRFDGPGVPPHSLL